MMKTGVMGGTFDPVHLGHLAVAAEAVRELALDEIIFMPAGHPYFKAQAKISPAEDRVNMLKLAIAGLPHYRISLIEIERPGPSYAVDSMDKMRTQMDPSDELFFIMGWDSLLTLYRWYEAGRLIRLCRIIAAPRPGYARPDLSSLEKDLPGISKRAVVMDGPLVDISSTDIRQKARQGLSIDSLVPPGVAQYIRERGLYR